MTSIRRPKLWPHVADLSPPPPSTPITPTPSREWIESRLPTSFFQTKKMKMLYFIFFEEMFTSLGHQMALNEPPPSPLLPSIIIIITL